MNKLAQARNEYGITKAQLSRDTGIPLRTIQNWEYGVNTPNINDLYKLAQYFNLPMEYFVPWDNKK